MPLDEGLRTKLDQVCLRLRRQVLLDALVMGLLTGIVGFLVGRLAAWIAWPSAWPWLATSTGVVAGAAGFILSPRPPVDRQVAARAVDRHLALEDRLATAVEWVNRSHEAPTLLPWLQYDAAVQAPFINPAEVVPIRAPRHAAWAAAALAVVLFSLSPLMPSWPSSAPVGAVPSAPDPALAQQATELELLAQRLRAQAQQEDSVMLARLADELAQLAAGLRQGTISRNDAQAALAALEQQLLDYQLQQSPLDPPGGVPGILGAGPRLQSTVDLSRLEALARALQAQSGIDAGLRRDLMQQLEALRRAAGSDPVRAAQLERLASALANNDAQAAGQELESLASDLRQQAAQQGVSTSSLEQIREELAAQSGSLAAGAGQGATDSSGAGGYPMSGGMDPSSTPQAGGPGGGTEAGAGSGSSAGGGGRFPGDVGYVPAPLEGRIGEGGLPQVAGIPGAVEAPAGAPNGAPGSYQFAPAPEAAVEREDIPVNYRQWVKRYFAALRPTE